MNQCSISNTDLQYSIFWRFGSVSVRTNLWGSSIAVLAEVVNVLIQEPITDDRLPSCTESKEG